MDKTAYTFVNRVVQPVAREGQRDDREDRDEGPLLRPHARTSRRALSLKALAP